MKKIIGSIIASLLLALSFVSFSAAETSKTYYEKENGVWTGVSNQYTYSNDVLKVRVKRIYDANGKIKSKVEYEYVNGLYNGVSTEVLFDTNGKMTKKVKRSYSGKGVLRNQVEYGYKNGVWDGTSKEISYNSDSSRNRVTKRTYNSAGKLQYRSEFIYSGYLIESSHYDYNTKNGKVTKEVYKEYNQKGVKTREVVLPYTNGKWTGVSHTSEYDSVSGAKHTRYSQTYNGKGEIVYEISYEYVSAKVGWKKTAEIYLKNEEITSLYIKTYDPQTGIVVSHITQSAIKDGKYSITTNYYNRTTGKIEGKVELFYKKGVKEAYQAKTYMYENGKWDGDVYVTDFDSKGDVVKTTLIEG